MGNKEKDAVRKAQADKDANQNKAEYDTKLGQGKKEEKAAAVNVLAKQKILKQTEADDAAEKSNAERAAKKDEKAQKTAVKQTKDAKEKRDKQKEKKRKQQIAEQEAAKKEKEAKEVDRERRQGEEAQKCRAEAEAGAYAGGVSESRRCTGEQSEEGICCKGFCYKGKGKGKVRKGQCTGKGKGRKNRREGTRREQLKHLRGRRNRQKQ